MLLKSDALDRETYWYHPKRSQAEDELTHTKMYVKDNLSALLQDLLDPFPLPKLLDTLYNFTVFKSIL